MEPTTPPTSGFDPGLEDSQILALAFPTPARAKAALEVATELHDRGLLVVHDAVFLFRPTEAPATVRETRDPSPTQIAVPSSLLGALLGVLLAGPIGLVIGGAVGAGGGALAAKAIDLGIPDAVVIQLREITAPGDTVLALLVSGIHGAAAIDALRTFQGARVVYATLPAATLEIVRRTLTPPPRPDAGRA